MSALDNAKLLARWLLTEAVELGPEETWDSGDFEFRGHVTNNGFVAEGSGYYAEVYSHPQAPGLVIKVSIHEGDTAPLYLAWARANPQRYVPNVHFMERRGQYTVAVLDKLRPMDMAASRVYGKNLNRNMNKSGDHPICRTAAKIRTFFEGVARLDLHEANVMMDNNDQLVITDPVSNSNYDEESRARLDGIERAFGMHVEE